MKTKLLGIFCVMGFASSAQAAIEPEEYKSRSETTGYVGVRWVFDDKVSKTPQLILGIRDTTTNKSNKVSGADLSLSVDLTKGQVADVRLGWVGGKCDALATAGVGYSMAGKAPLGYLGVAGKYSKLFGQVGGNANAAIGLELNTMDCPRDRKRVSLQQDA